MTGHRESFDWFWRACNLLWVQMQFPPNLRQISSSESHFHFAVLNPLCYPSFHKDDSIKKMIYCSWQCLSSMSDVESSLCVVGIPQSSWAAFPPPPQTGIRFSQITSEWMVNTACLASAANRGSGLHVDVPSQASLDRFVWSLWRPVYEYLGMDSMYTHHTQTQSSSHTIVHTQVPKLCGNNERNHNVV